MTIAVLVESSDYGVRVLSCPATELIAEYGSFVMWPRSANPIHVPYAWTYQLRIRELGEVKSA
jgi:hypothetical protein